MSKTLKPLENTPVELVLTSATFSGRFEGTLFKRTKQADRWGVVSTKGAGLFSFAEQSVQSVQGRKVYLNV